MKRASNKSNASERGPQLGIIALDVNGCYAGYEGKRRVIMNDVKQTAKNRIGRRHSHVANRPR
jgi:hypothetical protein